MSILSVLGAALFGSFSAPSIPLSAFRGMGYSRGQAKKSSRSRKIRADKEGLPRFYPGAKLARKAAQGKLTLRG